MSSAALCFMVVCEAAADRELVAVFADRIAVAEHLWLDGIIESVRKFAGATPSETFVRWAQISRMCEERRVPRAHGLGYALGRRSALMALRLALTLETRPTAVVLLHDSDEDYEGWRESLEAARRDFCANAPRRPFPVVIGVAHPEREAWVLAGFEPKTPDEQSRCAELRAELGFNPWEHAERLTSAREIHKKDAKRILQYLTTGDHERELACLREADLEKLGARGEASGLRAFLAEIRERLAPCYVKA